MANSDKLKYEQRGVSAQKEDVHRATKNLAKGLFPNAFCKIYPDYLANDPAWCTLMHADGTGTKSVLAYLYWRETGDLNVWRALAQDAIVMNLDDLMCAGATGPFLYSSIINRNKHLMPGDVISALIEGASALFDQLAQYGIDVHYTGGETADVGDVVRTISVDGTMTARMKQADVITNEQIQPGDVIVGLASSGQTTYEEVYNSGIGSNGLTSARHDVLAKSYAQNYPEAYDPATDNTLIYSGQYGLTDRIEDAPLDIGQLLLSPTRTYAPVLKEVLAHHRANIHSMIHCTGGAQTKILHFVENLHIIKDNLFPTPPVFQLIQSSSATTWKEMYEVLNMGHRLEIYTDETTAQSVIDIAARYNLDAQVIGRCEASPVGKQLTIESEHGQFKYSD